jgi:peptide chain release factor subunit 1
MISLIVPAKDQISKITKLLTDEYGKASNIKSRVNRQSVQTAIVSTKERIKINPSLLPHSLTPPLL